MVDKTMSFLNDIDAHCSLDMPTMSSPRPTCRFIRGALPLFPDMIKMMLLLLLIRYEINFVMK